MQNVKKDFQLLVVGLGNPGTAYARTRHNLGNLVVQKFAEKERLSFRYTQAVYGNLAQRNVQEMSYALLLPMTYMNNSGISVRASVEMLSVLPENCLVVCDDIDLSFGEVRFREMGGSGGHNGLRSVQAYLKTMHYPRLRLGVGRPEGDDVAEYVLNTFSRGEQEALPEFIDAAVSQISSWLISRSRR